jgi:hypothetical protein
MAYRYQTTETASVPVGMDVLESLAILEYPRSLTRDV